MPNNDELTRADYIRALLGNKNQYVAQGGNLLNPALSNDISGLAALDTSFNGVQPQEQPKQEKQPNGFDQFMNNVLGFVDEIAAKFGSGYVGAWEGFLDLGATALGAMGWKEAAEWAKQDIGTAASEWVKSTLGLGAIKSGIQGNWGNKDYWNTVGENLVDVLGSGFFVQNKLGDVRADLSDKYYGSNDEVLSQMKVGDWEAGEFLGGIAKSVGSQFAARGLGKAFGAASGAQKGTEAFGRAREFGNLLGLGVGAAGKGSEQALNEGASAGKALGYGAASGSIEVLSEKIVGPILEQAGLGINAVAGQTAKQAGKEISKTATRELAKNIGKAMFEEGMEEVFSALFEPITQSIYKGKDAFKDNNGKFIYTSPDFWVKGNDSVLGQFASGAVSGGIMSGVSETSMYKKLGKDGYMAAKTFAAASEKAGEAEELRKQGKGDSAEYKKLCDEVSKLLTEDYTKYVDKLSDKQMKELGGLLNNPQAFKRAMEKDNAEKTNANLKQYIQNISKQTSAELASRPIFNDIQRNANTDVELRTQEGVDANYDPDANIITVDPKVFETEGGKKLLHEYLGHAMSRNISLESQNAIYDKIHNTEDGKFIEEKMDTIEEYKKIKKDSSEYKEEVISQYLERVFGRETAGKTSFEQLGALNQLVGKKSLIDRFLDLFSGVEKFKSDDAIFNEYTKLLNNFIEATAKNGKTRRIVAIAKKLNEKKELSEDEKKFYKKYKNIIDAVADLKKRGTSEEVKYAKELAKETDSKGRTLSEQQAEFFKDSKVRDKNGNLLIMYHGSSNDFTVFDQNKIGDRTDANNPMYLEDGEGFYFTSLESESKEYGNNVFKVYLNIGNPYIAAEKQNLTVGEWLKTPVGKGVKFLLNQKLINTKEMTEIWKYPYRLFDILTKNIISPQAFLSQYGYDGVFEDNADDNYLVAVAFESNQIKNVDNLNPTKNDDIRYSKDLVAGKYTVGDNNKPLEVRKKSDGKYEVIFPSEGRTITEYTNENGDTVKFNSDTDVDSYLKDIGAKRVVREQNTFKFESEKEEANFRKQFKQQYGFEFPKDRAVKPVNIIKGYKYTVSRSQKDGTITVNKSNLKNADTTIELKNAPTQEEMHKADETPVKKKFRIYNGATIYASDDLGKTVDVFNVKRNAKGEKYTVDMTNGKTAEIKTEELSYKQLKSVLSSYTNVSNKKENLQTVQKNRTVSENKAKSKAKTSQNFQEEKTSQVFNGEIRVYHGTANGEFDSFDNSKSNHFVKDREGIYTFTDSQKTAVQYTYDQSNDMTSKNSYVYGVKIKAKNVLIIDADGHYYKNIDASKYVKAYKGRKNGLARIKTWYSEEGKYGNSFFEPKSADINGIVIWAKQNGYDGVAIYNVYDTTGLHNEFSVFDSKNIEILDRKRVKEGVAKETGKGSIVLDDNGKVIEHNDKKVNKTKSEQKNKKGLKTDKTAINEEKSQKAEKKSVYKDLKTTKDIVDQTIKNIEKTLGEGYKVVPPVNMKDFEWRTFTDINQVQDAEKQAARLVNKMLETTIYTNESEYVSLEELFNDTQIEDLKKAALDIINSAPNTKARTAATRLLEVQNEKLADMAREFKKGQGRTRVFVRLRDSARKQAGRVFEITGNRIAKDGIYALLDSVKEIHSNGDTFSAKNLRDNTEETLKWYNEDDVIEKYEDLPFRSEIREALIELRDSVGKSIVKANGTVAKNVTTETMQKAIDFIRLVKAEINRMYKNSIDKYLPASVQTVAAMNSSNYGKARNVISRYVNMYKRGFAPYYAVLEEILGGNSAAARILIYDMQNGTNKKTLYVGTYHDLINKKLKELNLKKNFDSKKLSIRGQEITIDQAMGLYLSTQVDANFKAMDESGVKLYDTKLNKTVEFAKAGEAAALKAEIENLLPEDYKKLANYLLETLNGSIKGEYIDWYENKFGKYNRRNEIGEIGANTYWMLARSYQKATNLSKAVSNPDAVFSHSISRTDTNDNSVLITGALSSFDAYINKLGRELYVKPVYEDAIQTLNAKFKGGKSIAEAINDRNDGSKDFQLLKSAMKEILEANRREANTLDRMVSAFSVAKLSLNIGSMMKQFASAFTSNIPIRKTAKALIERWSPEARAEFKKLFDGVWDATKKEWTIEPIGGLKYRAANEGVLNANADSAGQLTKKIARVGMLGISKVDMFTVSTGVYSLMVIGQDQFKAKIGTQANIDFVKEHWAEYELSQIGNTALSKNAITTGDSLVRYLFGFLQGANRAALGSQIHKFGLWQRNRKLDKSQLQSDLKQAKADLETAKANYEANEDDEGARKAYVEANAKVLDLDNKLKDYKQYEIAGGKAIPVRMASGLLAQGILIALVNALMKRIKGKKEWDELNVTEEGLALAMAIGVDWIPLVNFAANIMQGYEVTIPAVNLFNQMSEIFKSGKAGNYRTTIRQIALLVGDMTGIPFQTVYSYIYGALKGFDPAIAYEMRSVLYGASLQSATKSMQEYASKGNEKKTTSMVGLIMNKYKTGSSTDEINKELADLYISGNNALPKTAMTQYTDDNGDVVQLTNEQVKQFTDIYSQSTKDVSELMKLTDYRSATNEEKAKAIKKIYDAYYALARAKVTGKQPEGKLAQILALTNGNIGLAKYILSLQKIANITQTSKKTRKELVLQYINRLRGYTKAEKTVLMYLAGYSVSGSSENLLISFLVRNGASRKDVKDLL